MKNMKYEITCYLNHKVYDYGFTFETVFGAIYTARSMFENRGIETDVMNSETGEVIAFFFKDRVYISDEIKMENEKMAITEMR